MSNRKRNRTPTGKNYAKSLVLKKKISKLEREIKVTEAKMARCQLVTYEGKDHTFQPFWTNAPAAQKRPTKARDA